MSSERGWNRLCIRIFECYSQIATNCSRFQSKQRRPAICIINVRLLDCINMQAWGQLRGCGMFRGNVSRLMAGLDVW